MRLQKLPPHAQHLPALGRRSDSSGGVGHLPVSQNGPMRETPGVADTCGGPRSDTLVRWFI